VEIVISITGDPWMDWGLAAFAQLAEENNHVFSPGLQSGELRLDISAVEEAAALVIDYLQHQLNKIILLPPEAKLLGYPRERTENGYYNPDQGWKLAKEEQEQVIEALQKKLKREAPFKPNKDIQVSLKRNYPGLKMDWQKLTKSLPEDVTSFFGQWADQENIDNYCTLCGRRANKSYDMRQNKNPFYNQHHNNRIRGHRSNVAVNVMCPTCNLLNIFAAASADLPYFVEDRTHLLVPQVDDLLTLVEVRKLVRNNSLDMDSPGLISYKTNIRELPARQVDLYTSIIGVYWNLKYKYHWEPVTGQEEWGFGLNPEQQKKIGRWTVFRYSKGQNVIFAHFSYLNVDSRLFKLLDKLPYGHEQDKEGDLYRNLLKRIPAGKGRAKEEFSQGLVMKNWHMVALSIFRLFKDGENIYSAFLSRFIDYGLEVDNVLPEELLEDVRKVATTIGQVFANDIGLMSAINNVQDEASLRKVLKDSFLKMHKIAATQSRFGGEESLWVPGPDRVENILASVDRQNVGSIRDTMLIYATLAAMRKLQMDQKKTKGGKDE
jgi:hypothetical protein